MGRLRPAVFPVLALALAAAEAAAAPVAVRCLTEPVADVDMSTIVPGTVAIIHFDEGAFVERGALLLELDSRIEQLDIERRAVLVETLRASLDRSEQLLLTTSSISMEQVEETRGQHRVAAIELELARETLERRRIKAPITGIMTDLLIEVGEYCEPPQVLLRLVDTRQFNCVANIEPQLAKQLRVGDPVAFTTENGGEALRLPGEIVFISPVVDPASGLLRIKALFDNEGDRIRPGEGGFIELAGRP